MSDIVVTVLSTDVTVTGGFVAPVSVTVPPVAPVVISTPASVGPRGAAGESAPITFESVSQNLLQYPYTLNRTSGVLTSIVYDLGSGQAITKTLNRTGDVLSSIVLSGDTPDGISLTKMLARDGDGVLTGITYS
ncbi:MAG: hypothetical protein AAF141_05585 [Pseudomonadota bacterium]